MEAWEAGALGALAVVAGVVRVGMTYVGDYWDAHGVGYRYTDVDYIVFSDAARSVAAGGSAFDRATFRYPPLLAWLLLPTAWGWPLFGKFLFSAVDVAVGLLVYACVRSRGGSARAALLWASSYWFNPVTVNLCTRGSSDALTAAAVLGALLATERSQSVAAGVLLGIATHLRLFPAVFGVPLALSLAPPPEAGEWSWLAQFVHRERVKMAVATVLSLAALSAAAWWVEGERYLGEAVLYHAGRADPRHNFSVWWYAILLRWQDPAARLLAFVPQAVAVLVSGVRFSADPALAVFLQTLAFVAFNKVVTAQYFLWYIALLPVVAAALPPAATLPLLGALALWLLSVLHWLAWAAPLEELSLATFPTLWVAGLLHFLASIYLWVVVARHATNPRATPPKEE